MNAITETDRLNVKIIDQAKENDRLNLVLADQQARMANAMGEAARAGIAAAARIKMLEDALQFYANGEHFVIIEHTAWDTVSGEPSNFYEDDAGTATVEDGSLAKMALAGTPIPNDDVPATAPAPRAEDLFVTVPEVTLPNGVVVPSFKVGQYYCSKGADGKAAVTAQGKPWVRINYAEARQACADVGGALLTELQALAIAFDVSQQDVNWTGGKVGTGALIQGLHNDSVNAGQAGDYIQYDEGEDRFFTLSNGQVICDVAGNVCGWIFDNVQGDEHGLVAKAFAEDSPSIATAPYPSMKMGVGWRPAAGDDWSGGALVRGGCWGGGAYAGVFYLGVGWPVFRLGPVGFRCTK
jgi:hypothetical protein